MFFGVFDIFFLLMLLLNSAVFKMAPTVSFFTVRFVCAKSVLRFWPPRRRGAQARMRQCLRMSVSSDALRWSASRHSSTMKKVLVRILGMGGVWSTKERGKSSIVAGCEVNNASKLELSVEE